MRLFLILFSLYSVSVLADAVESTPTNIEEPFVCAPIIEGANSEEQKRIMSKMDKTNCILPTDDSIFYPKEKELTFSFGKLFVKSVPPKNEGAGVQLSIAHQCKNGKKSKFTTFKVFCGFQNSELDRNSPAIQEIRAKYKTEEYNRYRKLTEKEIDRLVAREINAWIADPAKNIIEQNGQIKIQTLKKSFGTTCFGPEVLDYNPNCK